MGGIWAAASVPLPPQERSPGRVFKWHLHRTAGPPTVPHVRSPGRRPPASTPCGPCKAPKCTETRQCAPTRAHSQAPWPKSSWLPETRLPSSRPPHTHTPTARTHSPGAGAGAARPGERSLQAAPRSGRAAAWPARAGAPQLAGAEPLSLGGSSRQAQPETGRGAGAQQPPRGLPRPRHRQESEAGNKSQASEHGPPAPLHLTRISFPPPPAYPPAARRRLRLLSSWEVETAASGHAGRAGRAPASTCSPRLCWGVCVPAAEASGPGGGTRQWSELRP